MMVSSRFLKVVGGVLGLFVLLVTLLPIFGSVMVTSTALTIPVVITRNGQELVSGEVRSVQYGFDVTPPKSMEEMSAPRGRRGTALREAHLVDGCCVIAVSFAIVRSNGFFSTSTKVSPEYRSVFLRIAFSDGSTASLSFPVLSDQRENVPMYIDIGTARQ